MPGRELISNLGGSELAHTDLDEGVTLTVPVLKDLIDEAALIVSRRARDITELLGARR